MNTERMTVHRALAELKTIDARINKAINTTKFCFANKHINTKVNGISIEEAMSQVKDAYKSINTLINRRNALKSSVALSNAETVVEINGKKYRVAEAIEMKNHGMDNYKNFLERLSIDYANTQAILEKFNGESLERSADTYVQGLFGSKEKVSGAEADETRKTYIAANTYDLIDPIKVEKIIKELTEKIETFMTEIDSALSVSNALTVIEISYEVE